MPLAFTTVVVFEYIRVLLSIKGSKSRRDTRPTGIPAKGPSYSTTMLSLAVSAPLLAMSFL